MFLVAARSALIVEQSQTVDHMPAIDLVIECRKRRQSELFTNFPHRLRRIRASGGWSGEHWLLALIPGTYFAVTNYLQHALVTDWFGSSYSMAFAAIAFLLIYNAYALIVRAQWRLANVSLHSKIGLGAKTVVHFAAILVAGSIHLLVISILTVVTREGANWLAEFGFYFYEIWISCMPIWGLVYLLTLGTCIALQSAPVEDVTTPNPANPTTLSRFSIRDNGRTHYIDPMSIRRIEAVGDYVKIFSSDGVFMPKGSITKFEEDLKSSGAFVRVHRSCLLRADCIKSINRMPSGVYRLELDDGRTAPVSRRNIKLVRRVLNVAPNAIL